MGKEISFSNASMLGLVTSLKFIQIYVFLELIGMYSYLLIRFWLTQLIILIYKICCYLIFLFTNTLLTVAFNYLKFLRMLTPSVG
ncbi:hypothetical protein WN944_004667 [Citrus x changshan-huyou]|uniref:Uncharacterized protein n=1 Tax=Citrus x changshan-huyou TaxID=2935761 RepID=A0AAP0QI09_9ROSI